MTLKSKLLMIGSATYVSIAYVWAGFEGLGGNLECFAKELSEAIRSAERNVGSALATDVIDVLAALERFSADWTILSEGLNAMAMDAPKNDLAARTSR